MAMAVDERLATELRRLVVGAVDEKFTEQECEGFELLRGGVAGKEVGHLVAEDGDAAGLEADDGSSGGDLGLQRGEHLFQQRARGAQHAEVVKWAAAAE